jgi:hypothetical protein
MPEQRIDPVCQWCEGRGGTPKEECRACGGSGKALEPDRIDPERKTRAGFVGSRETVLKALRVLGAQHCCYAVAEWPGRCDCKYGIEEGGSEQTGCPELASIYWLIEAMSDGEYSMLTRRAGGVPAGFFVADQSTIDIRLHRAEAAARMAAANIDEVRSLLTTEQSSGGGDA